MPVEEEDVIKANDQTQLPLIVYNINPQNFVQKYASILHCKSSELRTSQFGVNDDVTNCLLLNGNYDIFTEFPVRHFM